MATRDELLDTMWETAADILAPPVVTFAAVARHATHLATTVLSIHTHNTADQTRPQVCWPHDIRNEERMLRYAREIMSLGGSGPLSQEQRQLRQVIDGTRLAHMVVEAI